MAVQQTAPVTSSGATALAVFEGINRKYTLQEKINSESFQEYGNESPDDLKKIYQNAGWPVISTMMTTLDTLESTKEQKAKKDGKQSNNQAGISQTHITQAALYGKNKKSSANEGSYIDTTTNKYVMNIKDILPAGINTKNNDSNLSDEDFKESTNKLLVKYGKIASRPGYFSLSYSLLYKAIISDSLIRKGNPIVFAKNNLDTKAGTTGAQLIDLIKKHTTKVEVDGAEYYDYPEVLYFNSSQYRYNKDDTSGNSLNNNINELFVDTQINGLKNKYRY